MTTCRMAIANFKWEFLKGSLYSRIFEEGNLYMNLKEGSQGNVGKEKTPPDSIIEWNMHN